VPMRQQKQSRAAVALTLPLLVFAERVFLRAGDPRDRVSTEGGIVHGAESRGNRVDVNWEETQLERSGLPTDSSRILVGPKSEKRGVPEMPLAGPLHEADLRDQLWLYPPHFLHLIGSHASSPV
jgi:hypothetical protein